MLDDVITSLVSYLLQLAARYFTDAACLVFPLVVVFLASSTSPLHLYQLLVVVLRLAASGSPPAPDPDALTAR